MVASAPVEILNVLHLFKSYEPWFVGFLVTMSVVVLYVLRALKQHAVSVIERVDRFERAVSERGYLADQLIWLKQDVESALAASSAVASALHEAKICPGELCEFQKSILSTVTQIQNSLNATRDLHTSNMQRAEHLISVLTQETRDMSADTRRVNNELFALVRCIIGGHDAIAARGGTPTTQPHQEVGESKSMV